MTVEKFYNLKEASNILGIKVRTLRSWISSGKIKAKKYDHCANWFIAHDEIARVQQDMTDIVKK